MSNTPPGGYDVRKRDWIYTWAGPIASVLSLLTDTAVGGSGQPMPPADWIQLPGNAGSTVTFVNGQGVTVTLTSTSKINTWPAVVRSITSSSGAVTAGTGPCPPTVITGADGATGATGAAGTNGTNGGDWASVTGGAGSPITGSHTLAIGELCIVDNTANGVALTLPTAVGNTGKRCGIKDGKSSGSFATHSVTPATTSSQTIDGTTPTALATNKQMAVYVSDGANWVVEHY